MSRIDVLMKKVESDEWRIKRGETTRVHKRCFEVILSRLAFLWNWTRHNITPARLFVGLGKA